MIFVEHWGPILIALISGAGTVLVTLMKARGDKANSIPGAYQGLVQEMKEWTSTQLDERDRRIEDLEENVGELRDEVRLWRRKFDQAIAYIRRLRESVADLESLPPVPDHLRDDLDG